MKNKINPLNITLLLVLLLSSCATPTGPVGLPQVSVPLPGNKINIPPVQAETSSTPNPELEPWTTWLSLRRNLNDVVAYKFNAQEGTVTNISADPDVQVETVDSPPTCTEVISDGPVFYVYDDAQGNKQLTVYYGPRYKYIDSGDFSGGYMCTTSDE